MEPLLRACHIALILALVTLVGCAQALDPDADLDEQTTSTIAQGLERGDMPQPDPFIPKTSQLQTPLNAQTLQAEQQWRQMAARLYAVSPSNKGSSP